MENLNFWRQLGAVPWKMLTTPRHKDHLFTLRRRYDLQMSDINSFPPNQDKKELMEQSDFA